ncbi:MULTISPECIES: hypothetical protein [Tatumella]|uniref:Guanylate kinase n=2 Tax=Tatumella ptyseos TaxID=82987 RepID=A0A085JF27_9GAMM|nr:MULTISPECIES: hypothetical protein [Tatumella]KFD19073.1 guanylate kinase [Tatumella ptyseos ATCC 33301]SQK75232.1 Uncharacterised protein [Tatumella ptyseos]
MTRKTPFNGSAAGRRRQRRAALQSDASKSTELLHRPLPSLSMNRQTRPPTERAITPAGSAELQLYRQKLLEYARVFGHERCALPSASAGESVVTCHARQKKQKVSIPAYYD